MTGKTPWLVGLIVLAGVCLGACESDTQDGETNVWDPSAGAGTTGGATAGGATFGGATTGGATFGGGMPAGSLPPGAVPGTTAGGGLIPGPMPLPPDAGVFGPADAGLPLDASLPGFTDASTPLKPPGGSVDLSICTPPPAGASTQAVRAWTMLNELRLAAGAGCANMVPQLMQSAQSHCDYGAMNRSNPSCRADAHSQIAGCPGFTGADVQAREIAAGYPRNLAYTEVALTYGNNPDLSIPSWLATPYHRIPMVDPWTTDMGWGGGPSCDVIDFGRGTVRPPDSTVVVYPYDGQTDVPVSFNGLESPQPPAPASGWPSSFPVSIYAQRLMVTEHVLTRDGTTTPLDHVWLDTRNPGVAGLRSYFTNTAMLYGAAFEPSTKYRVKMVGSYAGGALNIEWTFTTGARRPGRF